MAVKPWTIQSARLRCPHCGKTVTMRFKGRWSIRKALGADSKGYDAKGSECGSLRAPEGDRAVGPEQGDQGAPTLSNARSASSQSPLSISPPDYSPERDEGEEAGDGA